MPRRPSLVTIRSTVLSATVAILQVGVHSSAPLLAQTQPPSSVADASANVVFEVASVKVNRSADSRIGIGFAPGGRFRATNVPLRELIAAAYGTPQPLPAFQISGGPKWIETERFDIVGKAPGDPQPGPDGPPREMFMMLRNLLTERGARRVWVCTLLDKPHKRRAALVADFVGFVAGDEFLVGYGLDWAHRFRGLPYIGVVDKTAAK